MKTLSTVMLASGALLAGSLLSLPIDAAAPNPGSSSSAGQPSLVTVQVLPAQAGANAVAELERMLHGGVEEGVLKAFVQNWRLPYTVTADQILHLHELGASTDVLTALIRRSAELQAQAPVSAPAPAVNQATPNLVEMNPPAMASNDTNGPVVIYPSMGSTQLYPSTYLYAPIWPDYYYRSWPSAYPYYYGWPYSYGWPAYRYSWGYRPWYRYPGHSYGGSHPGYYRGGGAPGWQGGRGGYPGGGRGYPGGGGGGGGRPPGPGGGGPGRR